METSRLCFVSNFTPAESKKHALQVEEAVRVLREGLEALAALRRGAGGPKKRF